MASSKKGTVTVRGRFQKGSRVSLYEVDGPHVQRAEGGDPLATERVKDDGSVAFPVEEGKRYIAQGYNDGSPVSLRVTGRAGDDTDNAVVQAPVGPDRLRLSDGSFVDEKPEQRDMPAREAAPNLAQDQVPEGVVQRSDTWRGTAHPLDPEEKAPYPSQDDVPEGTVQMSDTPLGRATPIEPSIQRQEDVPEGVWQRSDTELGQAYPLPRGDAVRSQQEKESADAKASRGEPVRAAAEPIAPAKGAPKE